MYPPVKNYRVSMEAAFDNQIYMANYQNILPPGRAPVMTKKYNPIFPRQFNKYLTPEELKTVVLMSPRVQLILESIASNTNQSRKELDKTAKAILDEIGLDRSLAMVRWAGVCVTRIGRRVLKGLYMHEANIRRVRDMLDNNVPVLYLPTHRSYCDFVLMSYLCFKYEIEIPGIAAGMDLKNMVGMGTFLRKNGAFYMRRSFTDDELYWDIFREYMHALVTDYHIGIEFFIEGTRTRSFKAGLPKIGLLTMALEPFFTGQVPDVLIVPISITYDKVLEEHPYVYESLGVPKPKETTLGFFKAMKFLEERFGRCYMDFAEPISAKTFFNNKLDPVQISTEAAYSDKLEKNELRLIKELAYEVVRKQQNGIVITTFNMIAVIYAYNTFLNNRVTFTDLCNSVLLLKHILLRFGAHVDAEDDGIESDVREALEIHFNILHFPSPTSDLEMAKPVIQLKGIDMKRLKAHYLNTHAMQLAVPVIGLQIYINPCMFWFSGPAIMTLAGMKLSEDNVGAPFQTNDLRLRVGELNSIFASEFVMEKSQEELEFSKNLEILSEFEIFRMSNRLEFTRNEISDVLLSTLVPFLCCYFHTLGTIIDKFPYQDFTEKELNINIQQKIEAGLTSRLKYAHPICLSLENIKIALTSFVQNGYVEKEKIAGTLKYRCNLNKAISLHDSLLQYLQLLPFSINEYCFILSKL